MWGSMLVSFSGFLAALIACCFLIVGATPFLVLDLGQLLSQASNV